MNATAITLVPGQFFAHGNAVSQGLHDAAGENRSNRAIATCHDEKDAERVALALNSHDELLEALKAAAPLLPGYRNGDDAGRPVNAQIRAAIAKWAEGRA